MIYDPLAAFDTSLIKLFTRLVRKSNPPRFHYFSEVLFFKKRYFLEIFVGFYNKMFFGGIL